jgi:hypothetical protein
VKTRCVVLTGLVRLCVMCAFVLLFALSAYSVPQNSNDEPAPVQLKLLRPIALSDLQSAFSPQIQPTLAKRTQQPQLSRPHPSPNNASGRSDNDGDSNAVTFYPGDLTYQGGNTVTSLESHDIYVNCDASCFGHPGRFLNNLSSSELIHVTDQYVGSNANHRYTVGPGGILLYPVTGSGPLGPNDIVTILYAAASVFGTGYGHIYHVFFAPGIDVCANATLTQCYSPDNPNTFFFCAFHASVDFPDIGHTLFSVQPYANIPNACQVNQPSPNNPEVDSQANVLSHELIEAITDPDGTAWWNGYDLVMYGSEIGDECEQAFFIYPNTNIGGHVYEIQPEYSNALHGCTYRGRTD